MNYWLVGAKWAGKEEALDLFLTRGYWFCFNQQDNEAKKSTMGNSPYNQTERFKNIKAGDRIAVKRRINGEGSKEMEILALGIAKTNMDFNEWRVYVDWFALSGNKKAEFEKYSENKESEYIELYLPKCITFPKRIVDLSGIASIHGPYNMKEHKALLQEIFFI